MYRLWSKTGLCFGHIIFLYSILYVWRVLFHSRPKISFILYKSSYFSRDQYIYIYITSEFGSTMIKISVGIWLAWLSHGWSSVTSQCRLKLITFSWHQPTSARHDSPADRWKKISATEAESNQLQPRLGWKLGLAWV